MVAGTESATPGNGGRPARQVPGPGEIDQLKNERIGGEGRRRVLCPYGAPERPSGHGSSTPPEGVDGEGAGRGRRAPPAPARLLQGQPQAGPVGTPAAGPGRHAATGPLTRVRECSARTRVAFRRASEADLCTAPRRGGAHGVFPGQHGRRPGLTAWSAALQRCDRPRRGLVSDPDHGQDRILMHWRAWRPGAYGAASQSASAPRSPAVRPGACGAGLVARPAVAGLASVCVPRLSARSRCYLDRQ